MSENDPSVPPAPGAGGSGSEDSLLLEQLRRGDVEAGQRFVRDQYPAIYRYLAHLTRCREAAEDLTQETFLRAWRHLDAFEGRSSLRSWLYRIAHREFLQALRRQRDQTPLEEIGEVAEPTADWTEAVALRGAIRKLPVEQSEVVLLRYLEGYTAEEIARILGAPLGRIKHRLIAARHQLQRELGEGDLVYLNEPAVPMRQWAWLPLDQMHALETRLRGVGCWVFGIRCSDQRAPNTEYRTPNTGSEATKEEPMERREFLRQAAVGAAGLMLPEPEKEVVDDRLTQKVTCAFEGTALSDLCEKLQSDTGIRVTAGPSVADERVTLFCEKLPLREVMRQLSRPFGYTWLRSSQALGAGRQALGESPVGPNAQRLTPNAAYRYELAQDLRSQLLEEELRNRDRNAALLALDRDMERYRRYLSLSPVEAGERLKTAPEAEKPLLEKLGGRDGSGQFGLGWGPIQMYFRLSRPEQEALRAGEDLVFTTRPEPGERLLPPEVARGVLESYRDWRAHIAYDVWDFCHRDRASPEDRPLTDVPEVRAGVSLRMKASELGTLLLDGSSRVFFSEGASRDNGTGPYASGRSPAAVQPENERLTIRFAAEPALRPLVTIQPRPGYRPTGDAEASPPSEAKVTPADLLEAFHHATGRPVVGDYYTRLYPPADVSASSVPLYKALNQLADAMRLRWTLADGWLQFRSASYYDDRLKEVPNRLLARWSAARQQRGFLSLDDLVQIAGLPDAQLDGAEMAEGAREIWGLREWDLPRSTILRPRLRDLVIFTPEQRQQAMTSEGLPFVRMSLPQQQQFISSATFYRSIPLDVFAGARLRIEYTRPGEFQWGDPDLAWSWTRWFVIREPGRQGHWAPRPTVRARTREAVAQAVLRLDPAIREGAAQRHPLRAQELTSAPPPVPLEAQIFATKLDLVFIYVPSSSNDQAIKIINRNGVSGQILI